MTGIDRITRAFEDPIATRADDERVATRIIEDTSSRGIKLMTHAVVGYPDMAASSRILAAMASAGADFIETQLPFSDPSADGRSIVEANYGALAAGSSTRTCLETIEGLRAATGADVAERAERTPILVMSYVNVLYAYGIDEIVARAAASGIDGFIVPDYPDDESELGLAAKCAEAGLALVPLIAPTTSLERAASLAAASASPFLYAVTRLGVTGRKTELDAEALGRLESLKERTGKRIAAGFGIRERSQVRALQGHADCAIVGSAIVDAIRSATEAGKDPAAAAGELVRSLKAN
jgi:tryptophan synthase alpha chain